MCKIRSIKQAADYFKQLDPETQITEYTLRKLIADGTIPSKEKRKSCPGICHRL